MLYQEKPFLFEAIPSVQEFLCVLRNKRQLTADELLEISYLREERKKKHAHNHSGSGAIMTHSPAGPYSLLTMSLPMVVPSPSITSPSSYSTHADGGM